MRDDYLIPGIPENVLRNTRGFENNEDLSAFEREVSAARAQDLASSPIAPTFDRAHLSALHAQLFKGVYPWAGHMRDESFQLPDGTPIGAIGELHKGQKEFAKSAEIDQRLDALSKDIAQSDNFRNLSPAQFAFGATNVLAELNEIHPFREGNGRTQRTFLSDLGREAGHQIDWKNIDKARNLEASIAVDYGALEPMEAMMRDAIQPERQVMMTEASNEIAGRADLDWMRTLDEMGDLQQRTLLPGDDVTGRLYGVTETGAMILDAENVLHIARRSDLPETVQAPISCEPAPFVKVTASPSHEDRVWQIDMERIERDGPSPLPQTKEEYLERSRALINQVPPGPRKEELERLMAEVEVQYGQTPARDDGFEPER